MTTMRGQDDHGVGDQLTAVGPVDLPEFLTDLLQELADAGALTLLLRLGATGVVAAGAAWRSTPARFCWRSARSCIRFICRFMVLLAGAEGLEPPTFGFGDRCSTKLSYAPPPIRITPPRHEGESCGTTSIGRSVEARQRMPSRSPDMFCRNRVTSTTSNRTRARFPRVMPARRPQLAELGLFLLVVALPLAFTPFSTSPFGDPKLVILVGGSLALWGSGLPLDRRIGALAALWTAFTALSALTGVEPIRSLAARTDGEGGGLMLVLSCAAIVVTAGGRGRRPARTNPALVRGRLVHRRSTRSRVPVRARRADRHPRAEDPLVRGGHDGQSAVRGGLARGGDRRGAGPRQAPAEPGAGGGLPGAWSRHVRGTKLARPAGRRRGRHAWQANPACRGGPPSRSRRRSAWSCWGGRSLDPSLPGGRPERRRRAGPAARDRPPTPTEPWCGGSPPAASAERPVVGWGPGTTQVAVPHPRHARRHRGGHPPVGRRPQPVPGNGRDLGDPRADPARGVVRAAGGAGVASGSGARLEPGRRRRAGRLRHGRTAQPGPDAPAVPVRRHGGRAPAPGSPHADERTPRGRAPRGRDRR